MIYVDTPLIWGDMDGQTEWGHLGTDDATEEGIAKLHTFAKRLGLKRERFQKKADYPHYTITSEKHALALKLGAIHVTYHEFVHLCSPGLWERMMEEMASYDASFSLALKGYHENAQLMGR